MTDTQFMEFQLPTPCGHTRGDLNAAGVCVVCADSPRSVPAEGESTPDEVKRLVRALRIDASGEQGRIPAHLMYRAAALLEAADARLVVLQQQNQGLLDFLESCTCAECGGTGRTSNHVTGEVECDTCLGTGHDSRKAFERLVVLQQERDEGYRYLVRLLSFVAPRCTPLPDLVGVATQIDNVLAGMRIKKEALQQRAETAEAALREATKK